MEYTPSYLTVDAGGRIGADFTGHLHAAGVDLDAATVASPPDDQKVRWLDVNNVDGLGAGSVVGWVLGWTTNSFRGNRGLDFASIINEGAGLPAETQIIIRDPTLDVASGGRRMVGLRLYDPTTGAISGSTKRELTAFLRNDADSGQITRKLLDSAGESDFLQAQKVNAKGDLYAGTGAQAFAMRSVGADGLVLVADSAQATGLNYARRLESRVVSTVQRSVGANSLAETSLFASTDSVPAGVAVNAAWQLLIAGTYNHATAGGSLNLRLKLGTVILDSFAIAAPAANQTNQDFEVVATIGVRTAGAAGIASGLFERHAGGAAATRIGRGYTSPAVDLTAAKVIDVTEQFGASNAANRVLVEYAEVHRIA